jgi:uncharacterized membrane protein YfcA
MQLWEIAALAAGGFVCGVLNALSGGGSFVTIPLLLLVGLPPQVANATNRIAIVLQCAAGLVTYHRHKVLPVRHIAPLAVPMVLGAIPGTLLAALLDESAFSKAAAVLFALMAATIFVDPKRWEGKGGQGRIPLRLYPLLFVLGVYGGFLQAGIGVLLISTLVLSGGYDVVRGNALKFALVLVFTAVSLALFAGLGQVRWVPGLVVAAGTIFGGDIGARLVIAKGARWVRWFVVLAAILAIVELLR